MWGSWHVLIHSKLPTSFGGCSDSFDKSKADESYMYSVTKVYKLSAAVFFVDNVSRNYIHWLTCYCAYDYIHIILTLHNVNIDGGRQLRLGSGKHMTTSTQQLGVGGLGEWPPHPENFSELDTLWPFLDHNLHYSGENIFTALVR